VRGTLQRREIPKERLREGYISLNLKGAGGAVRTLVISRDGMRLYAGYTNHTIKIWDLLTGTCLQTLAGHSGAVNTLLLTPQEDKLISGASDGTVKVWDLQTGQCMQTVTGEFKAVNSIRFFSNSNELVIGADSSVYLCNLAAHSPPKYLYSHAAEVLCIATRWSDETPQIVSGGADHLIKVKNIYLKWETTLRGHEGPIYTVEIIDTSDDPYDGPFIFSGSGDHTLRIWNMSALRHRPTIRGHEGAVRSLGFTTDDYRYLISGSDDGTIRKWFWLGFRGVECAQILPTKGPGINAIAVTPDNLRVASGYQDGTITVWNFKIPYYFHNFNRHYWTITGITVTPDRTRAITCSTDDTLKVWDLQTGQCLQTLGCPLEVIHFLHDTPITIMSQIWDVAVTPNGKYAVAGSSDGTVKVWDLQTRNCIRILKGHSLPEDILTSDPVSSHGGPRVEVIAVTSDSQRVISGSEDHTVKLWDIETGECLLTLDGYDRPVWALAVTPDDRKIVAGYSDGAIKVWSAKIKRCLRTWRARRPYDGWYTAVCALTLSQDGKYMIFGTSCGTVELWDFKTGKRLQVWDHDDLVESVAISEDNRYIISGSGSRTVKLWDVTKDTPIFEKKFNSGVTGVCVAKKAEFLAVDEEGTLCVISIPP